MRIIETYVYFCRNKINNAIVNLLYRDNIVNNQLVKIFERIPKKTCRFDPTNLRTLRVKVCMTIKYIICFKLFSEMK